MPNVQTNLFELFGHTWSAVTSQAETRLFLDVGQRHQIRSLPATGWAVAKGPQSTSAASNNAAETVGWDVGPMLFINP